MLDEIEKAGAEVFDLFLTLFDEGRITDRYGRATYFRSAIIIMTSNLGADKMAGIGFGKANAPSYDREAMTFFRPEFYNRIDALARFNPLDEEMIFAITNKELREIAEREGLIRSSIKLACSQLLIAHLAKTGFDVRYGARPLQRTIETLVIAPLARYLIEHEEIKSATIEIDLDDEKRVNFKIADLKK